MLKPVYSAKYQLALQNYGRNLSKWFLLLKPGVHIRPDNRGVTVKKPKGDSYVIKHFPTMDEAHRFYFEGMK